MSATEQDSHLTDSERLEQAYISVRNRCLDARKAVSIAQDWDADEAMGKVLRICAEHFLRASQPWRNTYDYAAIGRRIVDLVAEPAWTKQAESEAGENQ